MPQYSGLLINRDYKTAQLYYTTNVYNSADSTWNIKTGHPFLVEVSARTPGQWQSHLTVAIAEVRWCASARVWGKWNTGLQCASKCAPANRVFLNTLFLRLLIAVVLEAIWLTAVDSGAATGTTAYSGSVSIPSLKSLQLNLVRPLPVEVECVGQLLTELQGSQRCMPNISQAFVTLVIYLGCFDM